MSNGHAAVNEFLEQKDYAMPVWNMLYDGVSYLEQAKKIWEYHRKDEKEKLSGAEYLSRFRKGDKLIPVITVVFYYGTEKWDGSLDLYDMFQDDEFIQNEIVQKYIPNYKINLIDADSIEDVNCFRTDLKEIFGMMKCRQDKQALMAYMNEHGDYFHNVDGGTYRAIAELLQSKRMLKKAVSRKETEGKMDMCKALDDLYQDGKEEGREEGIMALVAILQELGSVMEFAVSKIMEKFDMNQDTAQGYVEKYWKV